MVRSAAQRRVSNHAGPARCPSFETRFAAPQDEVECSALTVKQPLILPHGEERCAAACLEPSNSQASSARVLSDAGASVIPIPCSLKPEGAERRQAHQQFHACEARSVSCAGVSQSAQRPETRSPLGAPPRRFLPSGLLRSTPGPAFRPDPAGFRLRSSGSVCHAAGPRSRAGQQPRGSRRWLAKPSAGAAPAPPIKTPHDGAPGMSRQQQDTELR